MSYANRPLNRQDYKTLTLAALGGALEFYGFIIFVFFAAVVGELFFPADIPEWLRQVTGGENVHPQHPADGAANPGDRSATDL